MRSFEQLGFDTRYACDIVYECTALLTVVAYKRPVGEEQRREIE